MLSTSEFNFDKKTRTLSAEASELTEHHSANLRVKSQYTNKVVHFVIVKTLYDASHEDVTGWEYKPLTELNNVDKLIIWND